MKIPVLVTILVAAPFQNNKKTHSSSSSVKEGIEWRANPESGQSCTA